MTVYFFFTWNLMWVFLISRQLSSKQWLKLLPFCGSVIFSMWLSRLLQSLSSTQCRERGKEDRIWECFRTRLRNAIHLWSCSFGQNSVLCLHLTARVPGNVSNFVPKMKGKCICRLLCPLVANSVLPSIEAFLFLTTAYYHSSSS